MFCFEVLVIEPTALHRLRQVFYHSPAIGLYVLCIWLLCLLVCLCTTFVPGPCGGWERVFNPLELTLQMVVSHCVYAGTQTCVL